VGIYRFLGSTTGNALLICPIRIMRPQRNKCGREANKAARCSQFVHSGKRANVAKTPNQVQRAI
jgi:hypothetical protein